MICVGAVIFVGAVICGGGVTFAGGGIFVGGVIFVGDVHHYSFLFLLYYVVGAPFFVPFQCELKRSAKIML